MNGVKGHGYMTNRIPSKLETSTNLILQANSSYKLGQVGKAAEVPPGTANSAASHSL